MQAQAQIDNPMQNSNSDSDSDASGVSEAVEKEIEVVVAAPAIALAPSGTSSDSSDSSSDGSVAAAPPGVAAAVAAAPMPDIPDTNLLKVEDVKALLVRSQARGKLVEAAEYLVMKIDKRLYNPQKYRGKLVTRDTLKTVFDTMLHIDQSSLADWE